jgi:hypothetical protein
LHYHGENIVISISVLMDWLTAKVEENPDYQLPEDYSG